MRSQSERTAVQKDFTFKTLPSPHSQLPSQRKTLAYSFR
uniref:Uncharacterized protein n=1 Tax=Anguilla anguilla TaxID=7936 RepID=A0A0E9UUR4_ANGAN